MKRIVSLVLCMALAIGAVTYKPPKADAIALELSAALIGKVVGVSLISLGMAWAIDQISINATGDRFGESVAREIQNWLDEEHDCEVIDVFFGGMMPSPSPDPSPSGNAVITASAAFIAAVSAFGKWLYDKYALSNNLSSVVSSVPMTLVADDGTSYNLPVVDLSSLTKYVKLDNTSPVLYYSNVSNVISFNGIEVTFSYSDSKFTLVRSDGYTRYWTGQDNFDSVALYYHSPSGNIYPAFHYVKAGSSYDTWYLGGGGSNYLFSVDEITPNSGYSLSVSAPNGLNLPDTDALPEGQGYALELPETNGAPIQDLNDLMDLVVPMAVNNPEYVPTLNPAEITNPDPIPNPDGEEVPEPAPAGATIIDYLVDIWRKIKALPETIPNGIKKAFEPDPELVTEITTTFTDKFGWLETIHQLGLDLCGLKPGSEPPVIFIHLEDATGKYNYGGTEKALDMSWYEPYKEDVDNIISGFMWLAFLWLVFKRAADIINGAGMVSDYEFYGFHPIDQPRLEEHKK